MQKKCQLVAYPEMKDLISRNRSTYLLPTLIYRIPVSKPSPVQILRRVGREHVGKPIHNVVLQMVKVPNTVWPTIDVLRQPTIVDSRQLMRCPLAIRVDWVWNMDGFQSMVQ